MARSGQFSKIDGYFILKEDSIITIQFLKKANIIYLIIIQDNHRENVDIYFLKNNTPFFAGFFRHGELNVFDHSLYVIDNQVYQQKDKVFTPTTDRFLFARVENYIAFLLYNALKQGDLIE